MKYESFYFSISCRIVTRDVSGRQVIKRGKKCSLFDYEISRKQKNDAMDTLRWSDLTYYFSKLSITSRNDMIFRIKYVQKLYLICFYKLIKT